MFVFCRIQTKQRSLSDIRQRPLFYGPLFICVSIDHRPHLTQSALQGYEINCHIKTLQELLRIFLEIKTQNCQFLKIDIEIICNKQGNKSPMNFVSLVYLFVRFNQLITYPNHSLDILRMFRIRFQFFS